MPSLYRQDLAYVHHSGFAGLASGAADGVLEMLRRASIRGGLVVDLGCGSGVWARRLADAGYSVLGVDASRAMTKLARRTAPAPHARFITRSLHDAPIPAAAAVTAIGEVLGYPSSERDRTSLAPLFARVARALPPGGLFVFDVIVRGAGRPMRYRAWTAGDDWAVLADVQEDPRRSLIRREITTFRRVGRGYRRSVERHWVRVWARTDIERWLRGAGFSVRALRGYGSYRLAPRRLAFRARKLA